MAKKVIGILGLVILVLVLLNVNFLTTVPLQAKTFAGRDWGTLESSTIDGLRVKDLHLTVGMDVDTDEITRSMIWLDFDTTGVPSDVEVRSVKLQLNVRSAGGVGLWDSVENFKPLPSAGRDLSPNPQFFWDTITSATPYVSNSGFNRILTSTGTKEIDLGEQAVLDLEQRLPTGIFSVAVDTSFDGTRTNDISFREPRDAGGEPLLLVDWFRPISVWRVENFQCKQISIDPQERTGNDFNLEAECDQALDSQKIGVYRFEDNTCTQVTLLPTEKLVNDYDSLAECESRITNYTTVLIVLAVALVILGGLIFFAVKVVKK